MKRLGWGPAAVAARGWANECAGRTALWRPICTARTGTGELATRAGLHRLVYRGDAPSSSLVGGLWGRVAVSGGRGSNKVYQLGFTRPRPGYRAGQGSGGTGPASAVSRPISLVRFP